MFIKRHHPGGVFHMCDQYYGFNAIAGGGLYVLSDPFGADPKLTNLLAEAVVKKGRLKGHSLKSGAFLSPELSYDAGTILFAYTQGKGSSSHGSRVTSDESRKSGPPRVVFTFSRSILTVPDWFN